MTRVVVALALVLPACAIDVDPHLGLDAPPHISIDLYDDGSQVRARACTEAVFLGCNPEAPDASISLSVQGTTYRSTTSTSTPQLDEVMSLFSGNLRVAAPSPTTHVVDVTLEPSGFTTHEVLPPVPSIEYPGTVSRSAAPLSLHYDARTDATMTLAVVLLDCPSYDAQATTREVPVPGTFEMDLAALTPSTGNCTTTVQIDQAVPGASARLITIARTTFTTTP